MIAHKPPFCTVAGEDYRGLLVVFPAACLQGVTAQ
jgi:hypothetical protein